MQTSTTQGRQGAVDRFWPALCTARRAGRSPSGQRIGDREQSHSGGCRRLVWADAARIVGERIPGQSTTVGRRTRIGVMRAGTRSFCRRGRARQVKKDLTAGVLALLRQALAARAAPEGILRVTRGRRGWCRDAAPGKACDAAKPSEAASEASVWRRMAERVGFEPQLVVEKKNLAVCRFLQIRQNRTKAEIETRIRHAERYTAGIWHTRWRRFPRPCPAPPRSS